MIDPYACFARRVKSSAFRSCRGSALGLGGSVLDGTSIEIPTLHGVVFAVWSGTV
jgi:hypothetical protein